MYTYQNDTLFTVFTTDWKTTVRKIRKFKYYNRISSQINEVSTKACFLLVLIDYDW